MNDAMRQTAFSDFSSAFLHLSLPRILTPSLGHEPPPGDCGRHVPRACASLLSIVYPGSILSVSSVSPTMSLDQLVKGAPAPNRSTTATPAEPLTPLPRSYLEGATDSSDALRPSTPDPLSTLPSSPPQIYLNLLILECSLRAQYLALRERRRQNTFFLLLLALWITYFAYALFLRPREDGRGVGGSVYWVVETGEKVALIGGVVTALLVWGTGQWERGVRWPRRWLAVANRGLRNMNTKIVVIRGPWWKELLSYAAFLFPFSSPFFPSSTGNFQYIERQTSDKRGGRYQYQQYYNFDAESGLVEEDLSPGGDYIRLLLLPKSFSPEFRERWDDYRTEFWEKENERRAQLRLKLRQRDRQLTRQEGGWLWWFGVGWRAAQRRKLIAASLGKSIDTEKHTQHRHNHHVHPSSASHKQANSDFKPSSRRSTRSESHSRTSSRSSTPVDFNDNRPPSRSSLRARRPSTPQSSGTEQTSQQQRRKKRSNSKSLPHSVAPLTQVQVREGLRTPPPSFSSEESSPAQAGEQEKEKDEGEGAEVKREGETELQEST